MAREDGRLTAGFADREELDAVIEGILSARDAERRRHPLSSVSADDMKGYLLSAGVSSQIDLAEGSGIPQQTINRWVNHPETLPADKLGDFFYAVLEAASGDADREKAAEDGLFRLLHAENTPETDRLGWRSLAQRHITELLPRLSDGALASLLDVTYSLSETYPNDSDKIFPAKLPSHFFREATASCLSDRQRRFSASVVETLCRQADEQ